MLTMGGLYVLYGGGVRWFGVCPQEGEEGRWLG